MRNRRHAILATGLAGTLCALLVAGPRAAQADELSQLRVNQVLLEQRLDQLAKGPPTPAGTYPSGAAAKTAGGGTAGSFPRSFLIPGTETSVRIGGTLDTHIGSKW